MAEDRPLQRRPEEANHEDTDERRSDPRLQRRSQQ
jgi:hypothetical protein